MIPKKIILHHSLTKDSETVSWGAIRRYHTETMGWTDIGYHVGIELINDHYEVLLGRMLNEPGAHTSKHNMDSLGICFIGNFDLHEVTPDQWQLGIRVVCSLCQIFGISPTQIYGHRHFAHKTCPGLKFNVEGFRLQVLDTLRGIT